MPELPEVEHLRRSLEPVLIGAQFAAVRVRRASVVARSGAAMHDALLVGRSIVATHRRGKQLALEADDGRILVIQLGMTGSVVIEQGAPPRGMDGRHRHVVWDLVGPPIGALESASIGPSSETWRMAFRDPRRFGGLTAYASRAALDDAWSGLGPDALSAGTRSLAAHLAGSLARSARPIKAALLDQSMIAGVGNIYADESLFASRIHPLRPARSLTPDEIRLLASQIRSILRRAADRGGSTLRDYRDAFGRPGSAVQIHKAYGREGEPCVGCGTVLQGLRLGGRATVFCPQCQHLST